jgi:4-hydroxy-tetrahydrodipicolinate synthase
VAERISGLDALLSAGVPSARVVVATGCAAFSDTVALSRHAVASGCPRCLVLPPFFWKMLDDEAVFRYYAALIDAVRDPLLRLYLYHIPQLSAVAISPGGVARLDAAYPGVLAGVKDSGGDFVHTLALLQGSPELSILSGHEPHVPQLMRAGGAGTICGTANLFPEMMAALLQPTVNEAIQTRIESFLDIVRPYPFVSAFKAIRAAQTGDPEWQAVRPPLMPLPEPERESLLADLKRAGLMSDA